MRNLSFIPQSQGRCIPGMTLFPSVSVSQKNRKQSGLTLVLHVTNDLLHLRECCVINGCMSESGILISVRTVRWTKSFVLRDR